MVYVLAFTYNGSAYEWVNGVSVHFLVIFFFFDTEMNNAEWFLNNQVNHRVATALH